MTNKDGGKVRGVRLETLCDDHFTLRKAHFELRRRDGTWQAQHRLSFDLRDAIAVLPFDRLRGRVLLIRQFRWPVFESGLDGFVIEAIAGKVDADAPEEAARREAMEEAGVTLGTLTLVSNCFPSPGAVKERMHVYLADYDASVPRQPGGGLAAEGEDIEVLELSLDEAFAMIASGAIIDAKTILLLQAAKLVTA